MSEVQGTSGALESMPAAPGEPAPGSCVHLERPEPGLVVSVIDPPHRNGHVVGAGSLERLDHLGVVAILAAADEKQRAKTLPPDDEGRFEVGSGRRKRSAHGRKITGYRDSKFIRLGGPLRTTLSPPVASSCAIVKT